MWSDLDESCVFSKLVYNADSISDTSKTWILVRGKVILDCFKGNLLEKTVVLVGKVRKDDLCPFKSAVDLDAIVNFLLVCQTQWLNIFAQKLFFFKFILLN